MKNLLLFGALTLCLNSFGQPTLSWAKSFGGTNLDEGKSISVDGSGNVYTTGYFEGTVDFDPGPGVSNLTSNGNRDIFIQKLSSSGNLIWAKSFGGTSVDDGQSILVDGLGNIYITGVFQYTVDFDPGPGVSNLTSSGNGDIFIQKLSSSGNLIWAKSFGGFVGETASSISVDGSGNVYTTGFFFGTADFDPGPGVSNLTSNGTVDMFIQKLSSSGNLIWAKSFGGTSVDDGQSILVDGLGNVYTTGYFQGTADFDPGPGVSNLTSNGLEDIFIQKLSSSGNLIWAKSFGGTDSDEGRSISIDSSGNVYTTGYFEGTVDFDPGPGVSNLTSNGNRDIYVQKLNSLGNLVWSKSFGGTDSDEGWSISVDGLGNVYTTGFFEGTVDFDPGPGVSNLTSNGNRDIFIQKLSSSGNLIWSKSFGGTNLDQGWSILVDGSGNVYTTGYFQGTVDFDPGPGVSNLTSNGNRDIYVIRFSDCIPTSSTDIQSACDSYTWVDGNTYTTSNNSATYTTSNAAGCDSTVTLDLTINPTPDNSITQNGASLTATQTGATYQWIDCDNFNAPITGEVNQTFFPTSTGNYAVEVTIGDCSSTSECRLVDFTGINEIESLISVHPNPTKDEVTLSIGAELLGTEFVVTDNAGRIVLSDMFKSTKQTVNLTRFDNGVYFIRTDNESPVKIIKQ